MNSISKESETVFLWSFFSSSTRWQKLRSGPNRLYRRIDFFRTDYIAEQIIFLNRLSTNRFFYEQITFEQIFYEQIFFEKFQSWRSELEMKSKKKRNLFYFYSPFYEKFSRILNFLQKIDFLKKICSKLICSSIICSKK